MTRLLYGNGFIDINLKHLKFSALMCLCQEKIYKLRFSSPLSLLLANFGF